MAKTKGQFALYSTGIPYVVRGEPVCQIVGEVYRVLRNDNYFFPVTTIVSFQWFRVVVVVGCCSLVWA